MDIVVEKDLADAEGENCGLKARSGVEGWKLRGRIDIGEKVK